MPAGGGKTRNRDLAAVALAAGKTVAQAAGDAGVSERAVYAWLRDKAFKDRVAGLRSQAVGRAVGVLSAAMTEAATKLRELLASPSETTRRLAAVAILELGLKGVEIEDVKRQLAELEAAIRGEPTEGTT